MTTYRIKLKQRPVGRLRKKWQQFRKRWTRVDGSVYQLNTVRLKKDSLERAYIGKYAGDWKERIRQHVYGGGPYHAEPKPFADLIPGYDPSATTLKAQRLAVDNMIKAGGAQLLWRKECFYWYLKRKESRYIRRRKPYGNDLENRSNRKRVPKEAQQMLREERDARAQRIREYGAEMPYSGLLSFLNPVVYGREQRLEDGTVLRTGKMFEDEKAGRGR